MAKGDDQRARNKIDEQGGMAQNRLNNTWDAVVPAYNTAQNNFTRATDQAFGEHDRLMGDYQNWAKTGGYSAQDIGNIRARSVAPIRGMYAQANQDVDRQRSLQGGYSPGYGTLKARMAREMSSGMSDASTNAEAAIAQLINSGKQFGMQGQSSLFSATPGMASTYGQFSNQAMDNWLQAQGLQNQLGLGIMGAQNQASQIPGKWQQGFDNAMKLGQVGAGIIGGAVGGGGGGFIPGGDVSGIPGIKPPKSYGY